MRRASAELEKRRASLGTTRGLRSDGTLDPYYAAILFRDSRGVSESSIAFNYSFIVKIMPPIVVTHCLLDFSCPSQIHSWKNTIYPIQVSSYRLTGSAKYCDCDSK